MPLFDSMLYRYLMLAEDKEADAFFWMLDRMGEESLMDFAKEIDEKFDGLQTSAGIDKEAGDEVRVDGRFIVWWNRDKQYVGMAKELLS